jgi:hypothetical protein
VNLTELWQQIGVGVAGGMSAEVLHWYRLARNDKRISQYTGPLYWITTVLMVLLGGVMPVLYISGSASALLCFHLGAATPLLVQKLVATIPTIASQGKGQIPENREAIVERPASIFSFFDW